MQRDVVLQLPPASTVSTFFYKLEDTARPVSRYGFSSLSATHVPPSSQMMSKPSGYRQSLPAVGVQKIRAILPKLGAWTTYFLT